MINRLLKYIFIFLTVVVLSGIYGCSGCSRSGIRHASENNRRSSSRTNTVKPHENNHSRSTSTKRSTPRETPKSESFANGASVSEMFEKLEKGVFIVYAQDFLSGAQGSGFFINSKGIGITNYHVLQGFDVYQIKTSDGKSYRITEILETSTPDNYDYVIFRVDNNSDSFKSMKIAKIKSKIGEDVFTIGSPRGLENSLSTGILSGYRDNSRIQIDATIDHGSSGGPLFNMRGEVIGITTSKIEGAALNFAVDIRKVPYKSYINNY